MHPGGPYWKNKDLGAWSIPKGEMEENENDQEAAKREFKEETGFSILKPLIPLQPIIQKNKKSVIAWAVEQDIDAEKIVSNFFEMEWPPKSGKFRQFPEMDRAAWFSISEAKEKILSGQELLLVELESILNRS